MYDSGVEVLAALIIVDIEDIRGPSRNAKWQAYQIEIRASKRTGNAFSSAWR